MNKYTYIIQNGEIKVIDSGTLSPLEAIQIARSHNLKGRFEIHHVLANPYEDEKLLVLYFIGKDDKIIGQINHFSEKSE